MDVGRSGGRRIWFLLKVLEYFLEIFRNDPFLTL